MVTDLEDSTWLWEHHPDLMEDVVLTHAAVVRDAVEPHGLVVKSTGDGVLCLFADATEAIEASIEVQRQWSARTWGAIGVVAARIGIHTGSCRFTGDDVLGPAPNLAARLQAAGHGGQILVSDATVQDADPAARGSLVRELGPHVIRSFDEPVIVHMAIAADLRATFPPLPRGVQRSRGPAGRRPRDLRA